MSEQQLRKIIMINDRPATIIEGDPEAGRASRGVVAAQFHAGADIVVGDAYWSSCGPRGEWGEWSWDPESTIYLSFDAFDALSQLVGREIAERERLS